MEDYRLVGVRGDADDTIAARPGVTLAIRDPEVERSLVAGLGGHGDGAYTVDRVLDAGSLLTRVAERKPRAVVLSEDLTGLTTEVIAQLRRGVARVVVIAADGSRESEWSTLGVRVVESDLRGPARLAAVRLALEGLDEVASPVRTSGEPGGTDAGDEDRNGGRVIALFGGKGSPGRTTLATSLAVGLAARWRRVALVDADLTGGDVAVHLGGLHPRSNLFTLAHGWSPGREIDDSRVEAEFQTWGEGDRLRVLVGLPKPGMAPRIAPELLGSLVGYLRRTYAFAVVDLGPPGPGGIGDVEAAVYRDADLVLAVCGAELLAAWHLQHALAALRSRIPDVDRRLRLVVNRVGRGAEAPESVAEALDLEGSLLGWVPEDRSAVLRSLERQSPLGLDRGRAGRALRALVPKVERELEMLGRVAAAEAESSARRKSAVAPWPASVPPSFAGAIGRLNGGGSR